MSAVVHLVGGARPNFMKIAPLWHALAGAEWCQPAFVHAGQHYDEALADSFIRDLGLPEPVAHLGVGSGTHAEQTARAMVAYEGVCRDLRPDWTVVVGDVNATAGCALAAVKAGVAVAHLEAGLRSGDRSMPEEINRIVTDAVAELLWTPSADADDNLRREGVPDARVELVGNVMIDCLELCRPAIEADRTAEDLDVAGHPYGVVTLHRPSNVDDEVALHRAVAALVEVAADVRLVFPVHPRTAGRLAATGLDRTLAAAGVALVGPLGYVSFIGLVRGATVVITDSGGIQEETTYLGVPCLTVRTTTERPVTVSLGTNRLTAWDGLHRAVTDVLRDGPPPHRTPPLWDGRAATRVAASLHRALEGRR